MNREMEGSWAFAARGKGKRQEGTRSRHCLVPRSRTVVAPCHAHCLAVLRDGGVAVDGGVVVGANIRTDFPAGRDAVAVCGGHGVVR